MGEPGAASDPGDGAESAPRDGAESGGSERTESGRGGTTASAPGPPRQAPPTDGDFGWRGWVLVGVTAVCFLVVPAAIVAVASRPGLIEGVGLTFRDAYLVLPTIPALVLAIVAVWAAVHARRD